MELFILFVIEQWILFVILLVLIAGLAFTESQKVGKSLDFHEATRLMNDNKAVLVDLRDANEYSSGHIPTAINIPYSQFQEGKYQLAKEKLVIIVDKMGQQAGSVSRKLLKEGYDVRRLRGGMMEWQSQKLPVVSR